MARRGPQAPHAGMFQKGTSGNPGGMTKAQIKERMDLRAALEGEGQTIHDALMGLVRDGNAPAIMYAHQQLAGKPAAAEVDRAAVRDAYASLTPEQMLNALSAADEG